ncbi:MAG TPA: hypothetical protein DEB70_00005 [Planctomycetaceae bacterium]|nr:hypothetical protein [Planctomycetaceae bacterium]|tara:strand:- start:169 stop:414 length:246 start_codon:yes stop_codon:yes gene_type:complete
MVEFLGFILFLWIAAWFIREYIPAWWGAPREQKLWAASFFTMLIAGFLGLVNVAYAAAAVLVISILGQFLRNARKIRQDRK